MKKCSKCNIMKEYIYFHKQKCQKDGYRPRCKDCRKEEYDNNRENVLLKAKEYRGKNKENPDFKERKGKHQKKYYKNNVGKIRLYHKSYNIKNKEYNAIKNIKNKENRCSNYEKNNEKRKLNRKQNNDVRIKEILSTEERRIAMKDKKIELSDIKNLLLIQQNRCFYCYAEFDENKKSTIDHYIPISKGGKHEIENIKMACLSCNCSKSNKMPEDFYNWLILKNATLLQLEPPILEQYPEIITTLR